MLYPTERHRHTHFERQYSPHTPPNMETICWNICFQKSRVLGPNFEREKESEIEIEREKE